VAFFKKSLVPLALITLLGLAAYSNTFEVPFQFDDVAYIEENILVTGSGEIFSPPSTAASLSNLSKITVFTRYLGHLSFAINYRLGGLEPMGYHTVNLAVHMVNALLVYWLVVLTFGAPALKESQLAGYARYIALFSALLFVSHPVQTQAVTYIAQRFTSLCAMFYLLSLTLYTKARISEGRKGRALYLLSFMSALMAMFTKEIAFTLPVAIALYELMFFEAGLKGRAKRLLPYLLLMPIVPFLVIATDFKMDFGSQILDIVAVAAETQPETTRVEYFLTQLRIMPTYLRLLLLPINQNLDYDYPIYGSFFDPQVFLSFLLLVSVVGLGAFLLRRSRVSGPALRVVSFGIFWFFIALSVESSFIPIADVIFEHRLYLPSVGVFLALASGAAIFAERHEKTRKGVVSFMVVVCLVFSAATYARNTIWKNGLTLWEDVVSKAPGNARAQNNLGYAYEVDGRFGEAIEHYNIALGIVPDVKTYLNASSAYKKMRRTDKAIEYLERAIRMSPNSAKPYNNLGVIYFFDMGQPDRAIEQYEIALHLEPQNAKTHLNIGIAYRAKGLNAKADYHLGFARRLNPEMYRGMPPAHR
jgi:Flp pilus assembly protein TadD